MARNRSAARLISRRRLVGLAALLTRKGQEEARRLEANLDGYGWLAGLDPDLAEIGIPVDEVPNPFQDSQEDPDYCLRPPDGPWPDNVVPMPVARPQFSAAAIAGDTFRTVSQAGRAAEPGLAVFGKGDGLDDGQRADQVRGCQLRNQPFAVIDPIDNIGSFLSVHGPGRYASVAIVAHTLRHLVVAVSAGSTTAVAQPGQLLIAYDDGPLLAPAQPVGGPVLPGSYVLETARGGTALAEPANSLLLNGVVLGGIEAGYQPDCTPCEGAASYLAAAAGRVILDAGRGRKLTGPHQVHDLLGHALRSGERVPGLIAAWDDLSARRLFDRVRRCGSA